MKPDDIAEIFNRFRLKMGGTLPADFIAWLEVWGGAVANKIEQI